MTGATPSVICFCIEKCLLFLICSTVLVGAAPRSKGKGRDGSPQLVYDQKQTGDYNIQLHLKDFQIIALLGDDSLGDYDYNYDYADFTVKPSGSPSTTTTAKPSTTARVTSTTITNTRSTSTTEKLPLNSIQFDSSPSIELISKKPLGTIVVPETSSLASHSNASVISNVHPYPIEVVVFEPVKKPVEVEQIKIKETDKLNDEFNLNNSKDTAPETSANEILNVSSSSIPHSSTDSLSSDASSTSPEPTKSSSAIPDTMTPGKIKVQILESPSPTMEVPSPTMEVISASVGIVPGEDVQSDASGSVLHGELASYRKCASGFSRDKKGRCRRTRRPGVVPQLPFGFGRIASNLATRLRLPSQEGSVLGSVNAPVLTERQI